MDRDDWEMLFRCLMQLCRHIAKKRGFSIKGYDPPPTAESRPHGIYPGMFNE